MLADMSDAALVSLFKSLDPLALPRYLKNGPNVIRRTSSPCCGVSASTTDGRIGPTTCWCA